MNDLCYLHCDPGFVPLTPGNRPNYCAGGVWSLSVESVSMNAMFHGGYVVGDMF